MDFLQNHLGGAHANKVFKMGEQFRSCLAEKKAFF